MLGFSYRPAAPLRLTVLAAACAVASALTVAAPALFAQTAAAADGEVFRQQPPVGPVTGDPLTLRQRILSATSYPITPGDTYLLRVQIGDRDVASFPLVLPDDYTLEVPFIGTLDVAGRMFNDVRREVLARIKAQVPVRFVSFTLEAPALFDVFIYGGVTNPGIYTVTPLSRISDLITAAGGPQLGSSLRRVELIRAGGEQPLDLTRFSTHGDLAANPILTPGDRVRVARARSLVVISGEVAFPGAFDLLAGEGIDDLIRFAGGTLNGADRSRLTVTRTRGDTVEVLTPPVRVQRTFRLADGDRINLPPVARPEQMVTVQGALYGKPVAGDEPVVLPAEPLVVQLPYRSGLSVLGVLEALGGPTPLARAEESTLRRAASGELVPLDAARLWATRDSALDLLLEPGDQLHVPLQNLNVFVGGEVNVPSAIPYVPGWTIGDYLRGAGGLTEDGAARFTVIDADQRRSRGSLLTQPPPGATVIADRNAWASTRRTLTNVLVVTGFVAAIISLIEDVIALRNKL